MVNWLEQGNELMVQKVEMESQKHIIEESKINY